MKLTELYKLCKEATLSLLTVHLNLAAGKAVPKVKGFSSSVTPVTYKGIYKEKKNKYNFIKKKKNYKQWVGN